MCGKRVALPVTLNRFDVTYHLITLPPYHPCHSYHLRTLPPCHPVSLITIDNNTIDLTHYDRVVLPVTLHRFDVTYHLITSPPYHPCHPYHLCTLPPCHPVSLITIDNSTIDLTHYDRVVLPVTLNRFDVAYHLTTLPPYHPCLPYHLITLPPCLTH